MSKSALYAGLGQGLMALGNHVGEAYRMQSIEELRQQNLERNWARQDAIRAEDRAFQKELTADNRKYQAEQTKLNREWQVKRENAKLEQQKGLLQETRDYEGNKEATDIGYEEADGKHFKVEKNASGKVVKRTELRTDPNKLPPMLKLKVESLNDEIDSITRSGQLGISDELDKRYQSLIKTRNDLLGMESPEPEGGDGDAPAEAIQYLRDNPTKQNKEYFKQTFGYLPAGL